MGKKKFRDSVIWQSEVMPAQDDFNFDATESSASALLKFKANKDMRDVIQQGKKARYDFDKMNNQGGDNLKLT